MVMMAAVGSSSAWAIEAVLMGQTKLETLQHGGTSVSNQAAVDQPTKKGGAVLEERSRHPVRLRPVSL